MDLTHTRIENGTTTLITTRAALDEINAGQMDKAVKRTIRSMAAARSSADIEYRDGRKVRIRPATVEEIAEHTTPAKFQPGQRIVVGNGTVQTVVKVADRIGSEPQRVEVEGSLQWLADDCEPAPALEYRTLKGAKVGDVITLWQRGDKKGPVGEPITITITGTRSGWDARYPSGREGFLGGTGSKYWVVA
ncbi:hypothetical protein [Kitasatospora sp. NPDC087315]|uniref:hypothetical protein n=1 Tax=Kitasatospora sp. NPDC087315 TaxID=3364069 RepID=UPI00380D45C8